jgi:hypothetical protein
MSPSPRPSRCLLTVLLATAALLALPAASIAAPDNDDFGDATLVVAFDSVQQTNVDAGELGEPLTPGSGSSCNGNELVNTVWFLVQGDGGPITVETRGSNIDTVLAVYDTDGSGSAGNDPPSADNLLDCADDIPGDSFAPRASELTFDSENDLDYLVQVGTCSGCGSGLPDEGTVAFAAFEAPPNDARAAATPLAAGTPLTAFNFGATLEGGELSSCQGAPFGKTVWFRYSAPAAGTAVFSASGSFFDSVLTVYRDGRTVGCNDDGGDVEGPSRLAIPVTAGAYLVQVGGYGPGRAAERNVFTAQVEFNRIIIAQPDRDGDGIPDASDRCPDENARARDANGDGCLDPVPPPPLKTLRSTVSSKFDAFRRHTVVRSLVANNVPAGARIRVTCRSKLRKRCPRSRTVDVRSARRKVNLRRPFRRRKLPAGTVLTVQITAPGYVGKVVRYKMRKRRLPRTTQLCLQPGAKRPGECD